MKTALLSLLLLSSLLAGCGIISPDDDADGVIMPLAIGNTWIGKETRHDAAGAVLSEKYDTLRVVETTAIAGETWFRMSNGDLYTNRKDGLWTIGHEYDACEHRVAKYPAMRGDTFNVLNQTVLTPAAPTPIDIRTYVQVTSTDTSIAVPLGTRNCYHYHRKAAANDPTVIADMRVILEHEFYAPNVGPVQRLSHNGKERWELVRVILN